MRRAAIPIAVFAIAVGGCGGGRQPIHNITNAQAVAPQRSGTASARDVATAILRAGSFQGWNMSEEGPGEIVGRLTRRQHFAVVDIQYDSQSYSIKYRESTNLGATDEKIHPAYNHWIQNLDKAIRVELAAGRLR